MDSKTYQEQATRRLQRLKFIKENIGLGNVIYEVTIDNHHVKGREVHKVTDTGIIIIMNELTRKIITVLIGRPAQIKKLYSIQGQKPPHKLMTIAYNHAAQEYYKI